MHDPHSLENHWLACMASAGGGGRLTRLPGAVVLSNPHVGSTLWNFIALRGAVASQLEPLLAMAGALLAEHGRPPAIFLSPAAGDMERIAAALRDRGWRRAVEQVVLITDLPSALNETESEVIVEEIDATALQRWGETLVEAYEVEPRAGQAIAEAWTSLFGHPGEGSQVAYYLARLAGQPVGTGLTWSQGEIAGLYCGAVLPAFRRRGVERATLARRLNDAARKGSRLAMLQTEVGSPVEHLCLARLGFRVAYHRELWVPASASPSIRL